MIPLSQWIPRAIPGWQSRTTEDGSIAVTFDDGPNPDSTPELLQLLSELDLKCTMFLVGEACERNQELLSKIVSAGHAVANHGYVHRRHAFQSKEFVTESLMRTRAAIESRGCATMAPAFRPPYGSLDWRTGRLARRMGLSPVLWSAHLSDWRMRTAGDLLRVAQNNFHDRMILLLHDKPGCAVTLRPVLEHIRSEITRRNWRLLLLPEESSKRREVA
ncbi:MAG: polysaccharide deacetylase family protein [Calditrichaeota bacterium]|nr:polysaccharide deacetylase family protein [Calditrichota bacterium]MCB9366462.1 polysaccharide deacetylase family protein [Calditrichota bacterium]MCB9391280.1 polysaccharide deacetylase family protein [Calditrichota bacterium]